MVQRGGTIDPETPNPSRKKETIKKKKGPTKEIACRDGPIIGKGPRQRKRTLALVLGACIKQGGTEGVPWGPVRGKEAPREMPGEKKGDRPREKKEDLEGLAGLASCLGE